ncbi:hypothetical protein D5S17_23665 [Pseudonocardiaceae bacterium YIM PH 21723]|nr:hypothetical protein D5S17_23665 [Pseudonocardiaceae bacterium YIM PH 21723]
MNALELRYRRLLRVLPRWYREHRADEMTEVLLAGHHGDRVPLREALSVLALAVRARVGGAGAPPRQFAWGETIRLIAIVGLLLHGAQRLYVLLTVPAYYDFLADTWPVFGPLLAFPVLALLRLRRYGWARLLTAAMFLPLISLYLPTTVIVTSSWGYLAPLSPDWFLRSLEFWVPALCVFIGFHRDAPAPSLRPWRWSVAPTLLSLGTCTALLTLGLVPRLFILWPPQPSTWYWAQYSTQFVVLLIAPAVLGPIAVLLTSLGRTRLPEQHGNGG